MTEAIRKKLAPINRQRWDTARLLTNFIGPADKAAAVILSHRAAYEAVQAETGVPWYVIGVKHMRECNNNMKGVLHNGEAIVGTGRKTRLVPAGQGPFATWHEAAVHAIRLTKLDKIPEWSIETALYVIERFNGFGYYYKGLPSAYVWSGTTAYVRGKYVADNVWSDTAVDTQLGCAIVLKRLEQSGVQMDPPSFSLTLAAEQPVVDDRQAVDPKSLPPVGGSEVRGAMAPVKVPEQVSEKERICRVQDLLKKRGYQYVGSSDGIMGPNTEAAIYAFRKANSLPPFDGTIDDNLIAALVGGENKEVSLDRQVATVEQAAVKSKTVQEISYWDKFVGWAGKTATVIFTPILAMFGFENIEDFRLYVSPFTSFIRSAPPELVIGGLAVVGIAAWVLFRKKQAVTQKAYAEERIVS